MKTVLGGILKLLGVVFWLGTLCCFGGLTAFWGGDIKPGARSEAELESMKTELIVGLFLFAAAAWGTRALRDYLDRRALAASSPQQ